MSSEPAELERVWQLHQSGQPDEAQRICRQILAANPRDAPTSHLLGIMLWQQRCGHEAISLLRRAIELAPANFEYRSNLAAMLGASGDHVAAVELLSEVVRLRPKYAEARHNLAVALEHLGRLEEAADSYRHAIGVRPGYVEAHNHLGSALRKRGQLHAAIEAHERALGLNPRYPQAWSNLATACAESAQQARAIECHQKVVELCPDSAIAESDLLHTMHYSPMYSGEQLLAQARQWAARHASARQHLIRQHSNLVDPNRRLRIGYVSPDFHEHPVARFITPVLREHDRAACEVICYSDVTRPDQITARIRSLADAWRDTAAFVESELADLVRNDRVDILIDLTGHMAGNRLTTFCHKPAPLQMTMFNYPGTTGLSCMHYRLSDPHSDPPGADAFYSEKLLRLADCAWCYEPGDAPPPSDLPCDRCGYVTFGSLNKPLKVTSQAIELWSRVLQGVDNSQILLLSGGDAAEHYFHDEFFKHGIKPTRLRFIRRCSRARYLETYASIDIALDTFPYNGGVTSADAMWMGVPLISLAGERYLSRQGVMLLNCVGLAGLVAGNADRFVAIAKELASNPERLRNIRRGLRDRMRNSPLCRYAAFTRQLEAAYRDVWHNWCATQTCR